MQFKSGYKLSACKLETQLAAEVAELLKKAEAAKR